jgi:hypothetical protein
MTFPPSPEHFQQETPPRQNSPQMNDLLIAARTNKATTERQVFIESLYYPQDFQHKPLTEEMKKVILEPLDDVITTIMQIDEFTPKRKLPTLDEWQQSEVSDLTLEEFLEVIKREKIFDEDVRKIFLRQFLIRNIDRYLHLVNVENYNDPDEQSLKHAVESAIHQPKPDIETGEVIGSYDQPEERRPEITKKLKQVRRLIEQFKQNQNVTQTIQCYEQIQKIVNCQFPKDLDLVFNDILNKYPEIGKAFENNSPEGLNELGKEIFRAYTSKKDELEQIADDIAKIRRLFNEETLSQKLEEQFEKAFNYFYSLIPQEEHQFFDKIPHSVLKLVMMLRKVLPVANAEVLAQIWWQLRLGGPRGEAIIDYVKKEWPDLVKKQRLEKYAQHLYDNYLSSEAAAFEFDNIVAINENEDANTILSKVIKNLIKNHIPKNQNEIRLSILDGEQKIRRLRIAYRPGLTDDDILKNISNALRLSKWEEISLDERERVRLSYLGYNGKKRTQDKSYQKLYANYGVDPKTNKPYPGDYLIQIGSQYESTRDPRSIFAVDSHKIAIQLLIKEAGKLSITTRYNHQHFDGMPAQSHTNSLIEDLKDYDTSFNSLAIIPQERKNQFSQIKESLYQPEICNYPIPEARADFYDDSEYESIKIDENTFLSSVDVRAMTIALANKIRYYQQLFANKNTDQYFLENPNYNNIQPVVVSLESLKSEPTNTVKQYRKSAERAKQSVGDVALFASIAGTKEIPLSWAGEILNPKLVSMLRHSQGMVSVISGDGSFTTAFSDAYRPKKIDLNNPEPSIGVIGIIINKETKKAHYTVRLLPSQAQSAFKEAVLKLCRENLSSENQKFVLSEFTKIIRAWDKLVCGQGLDKQISLEEYTKIRDTIFTKLINEQYLDMNKLEGMTLQNYLNQKLQEAANKIFIPKNLANAKNEIIGYF